MNLSRFFENRRQYREMARELNRLSARELSELGILRSDIPTLARQSVR